jgi:hypothetical protein
LQAQQVIVVQQQLAGSNNSLTSSINEWFEGVYKLKEETNRLVNHCYKNIKTYMLADIKSEKYQAGIKSNAEAAATMKTFLQEKYFWLKWIVYSFSGFIGEDSARGKTFWTSNKYGKFWSVPDDKNGARNIIATAVDKTGSFFDSKWQLYREVESLLKGKHFEGMEENAQKFNSK